MSDYRCGIDMIYGGGKCRRKVSARGELCSLHKSPKLHGPGQYIDVRSETRPEIVHHVYTGDSVQTPHCTCEAFRYGTRERDVLFVCKHIDLVVFGKGST